MSFHKRWVLLAFLFPAVLGYNCLSLRAAAADTNIFGFTGPEIFPIDTQVESLHVADMDGDGLNDIVIANNSRSKINILYNQTGKTNLTHQAKITGRVELNELPPDARFRIESIASEKRISGLVVADLNGDGRPDIAYYGEPKELVVQYNLGTNGWSAPKRWPIDDGQLSENALTTGDLNGDHLTDLILLSDNYVYFIPQKADHTLGEPQKIPFSGSVKAVQVLDVDGDGLSDLLLVNWEDRNPFRFRLQKKDGELGPEVYFPMPPIRSYWADNLETNSKVDRSDHDCAKLGARADLKLHAEARGIVVWKSSSRPIAGVAVEQNRQGASRVVVGGCERRWIAGFVGG